MLPCSLRVCHFTNDKLGAKVVVEDDGDDELPLPTNVEEVILNRPDLPANSMYQPSCYHATMKLITLQL